VIETIMKTLAGHRFDVSCESVLQVQIAEAFQAAGIEFQREVRLSSRERIDFMVGAIGIEVKISGQVKAIYRQCVRYCGFDQVTMLLLVTNRAMGLPGELEGKPCYVHTLGRSWL
jgi:hypothetical protein